MNAGLPGIGLSGVFYILSALLMPVAEVGRVLRGRPQRQSWTSLVAHAAIAAAMVAAMWLAGYGVIMLLRAAGHEVRNGDLWDAILFIVIPFAVVFGAVTVVGALRSGAERRP